MRKLGTTLIAGLMLASSTAAFAGEGALPAAQPADVHEARLIMGLSPATFAITATIVTTIVIGAVVASNSSSGTH